MKKFYPGQRVLIDTKNISKLRDYDVLYGDLRERVAFGFFGNSVWSVVCSTTSEEQVEICVSEKFLVPVEPGKTNVVIRYPSNTPVITQKDIDILDEVIKICKNNNYLDTPKLQAMAQLAVKLCFFDRSNEV